MDNSGEELDVMFLQVYFFLATLPVAPTEVLFWNILDEEDAIFAMLSELQTGSQARTRMTFTSGHGEVYEVVFN